MIYNSKILYNKEIGTIRRREVKYLLTIILISNISYAACIDIGIMKSTAQKLKNYISNS